MDYTCEICMENFSNLATLRHHVRDCCGNKKKLVKNVVETKEIQHLRFQQVEMPALKLTPLYYLCEACKEEFEDHDLLQEHKRFKCPEKLKALFNLKRDFKPRLNDYEDEKEITSKQEPRSCTILPDKVSQENASTTVLNDDLGAYPTSSLGKDHAPLNTEILKVVQDNTNIDETSVSGNTSSHLEIPLSVRSVEGGKDDLQTNNSLKIIDVCRSKRAPSTEPYFYLMNDKKPQTEIVVKIEPPEYYIQREMSEINIDQDKHIKLKKAPLRSSITAPKSTGCKKRTNSDDIVRTDVSERNHECKICHRRYRTHRDLGKHVSAKHRQKDTIETWVCEICGIVSTKKDCFRYHMLSHSDVKAHQCDFCGSRFNCASTLTSHRRIHTGEKPYKCRFCGRGFRQSGQLNRHLLSHTGERRLKCHLCGKGFVTNGCLRDHINTHTGQRPHKCDFCIAAFAARTNMREHRKIHLRRSRDKAYQCDTCNKTFQQYSNLKNHAKAHFQAI